MAAPESKYVLPSYSVIKCPVCANGLNVYDTRKSAYFGCSSCHSFFQRSDGNNASLRKFSDADVQQCPFPLGTMGTVEGIEYMLVGFIRKKQKDDEIYWNEYAFYSPKSNWYVILAEFDGNWMMIWRSNNQNIELTKYLNGDCFAQDEGVNYLLYLQYQFNIIYAEGEFDWNILEDESLTTYEYVNAPRILINEERNYQPSWFRASYLSPKALLNDFEIAPEWLPKKNTGIPFIPSKFYPRWKSLVKFTGITLALFLLITVGTMMFKPEKQLYNKTLYCVQDTTGWGNTKSIITEPFNITGPAPVYFTLSAPALNNSWIELEISLINDKDGHVYELDKTIEYYSGYEGGESWSEGDHNIDAVLSGVPSGTYHMNIYPATEYKKNDDGTIPQPAFDVTVSQNSFLSSNFWLMLCLILLYPTIQFIRKYTYENSKWFDKEYGDLPES